MSIMVVANARIIPFVRMGRPIIKILPAMRSHMRLAVEVMMECDCSSGYRAFTRGTDRLSKTYDRGSQGLLLNPEPSS